MIKELADFGKRIRLDTNNIEDSLCLETIEILIEISSDGCFKNVYTSEKESFIEDVLRTEDKGRTIAIVPRLLVDNSQYVLGFPNDKKRANECLQKFKDKINLYSDLEELAPVIKFYENKESGLNKAYEAFNLKFKKKELSERGNIAFYLENADSFIHENKAVYDAIKRKYIKDENDRNSSETIPCTICGKTDYRSKNIAVHGVIKKVPDGHTAGCSLISYNADAFESYFFRGNDNSTICTHCIKNYIVGLNWLMINGQFKQNEKDKKPKWIPTNRQNFGSDTSMIYWTREKESLDELNLLDNPVVGQVSNLIDSVVKAKNNETKSIKSNQFYSCTLSGAAARIAIRDWIEISLEDYKRNIAQWFKDIAIQNDGKLKYSRIYFLAQSGHNTKLENDPTFSRIANHLWKTALLNNYMPPLWILSSVLKRIRYIESVEAGKKRRDPLTLERASLIRLIINRNNSKNGIMMKEQLDTTNVGIAYMFGRIFAVQVAIQRAAIGKNINAGIREVFFSSASTNPAPAFGRIMRLTQRHLTKLKQEDSGAFSVLDRKLQELCRPINPSDFPSIFSLEEQGQFALGYYHQKQKDYEDYKEHQNIKLKSTTEED